MKALIIIILAILLIWFGYSKYEEYEKEQAELNKYSEKAKEFKDLMSENHNDSLYIAKNLYDKALKKYNNGKYNETINLLDSSLKYFSQYGPSYYYRALANYDLHNYKLSLADLNIADSISPNVLSILYYKSLMYVSLHDFEQAMIVINKAVDVNIDNPVAYRKRGVIEYGCGLKENACKDWKKAKEMGDTEVNEIINENCN